MKKILCTIISFIMLFALVGQATAAAAEDGQSNIRCNMNTASIVVGNKVPNFKTIVYNNRVYVPLKDICGHFSSSFEIDKSYGLININTTKGSGEAGIAKEKPSPKTGVNIAASIGRYKITVDGLAEYMESITYQDVVYIPVRYFAEIFDQKVDPRSDGSIVLSPKTDIIGAVNGNEISKSQFDYYYNGTLKQIESSQGTASEEDKAQLKNEVFNYVADLELARQKAEENKIVIGEEDLQKINSEAIDPLVANYQGIENLREVLAAEGIYFHQAVLQVKYYYIKSKLMEELTASVQAEEDEIKDYYDQNISSFTQPEKLRAKHILISTVDEQRNPLDAEKKAQAKAKAEDIMKRVENGEDFDKLMKDNSEDHGLADYPDGYPFGRGEMMKEFEDAAFSLEVGEVSGLVETSYGYHIIRLEEKIPAGVTPFEDVKSSIKDQLDESKKQSYAEKLISDWTLESKIENKMK